MILRGDIAATGIERKKALDRDPRVASDLIFESQKNNWNHFHLVRKATE